MQTSLRLVKGQSREARERDPGAGESAGELTMTAAGAAGADGRAAETRAEVAWPVPAKLPTARRPTGEVGEARG